MISHHLDYASHPPDHEPEHVRHESMSNLLDRGVAKFVEGLGVQTPDDLADFAQSVLGQSPHTIESADYDMHESQIYSYRHRNEGQALLPSASGASGLKSRVVGMRDDGARMRDSGSFSRGVRVQESPSERHRFLAHHDVDDFVPMRSLGGSASFSGGTRPAAYMTSMDESVGEFEVEAEGDAEMVDPLSASTPARLTHGRVFSSSLDDARMRPSYDARALFMDHVRDGSFVSSRDDAPHLRSEPPRTSSPARATAAGSAAAGGRARAPRPHREDHLHRKAIVYRPVRRASPRTMGPQARVMGATLTAKSAALGALCAKFAAAARFAASAGRCAAAEGTTGGAHACDGR